MNEFTALINKRVERLFIILWPPEGEETLVDVDMSIGFVFAESPDQFCVVRVDYGPGVSFDYEPIPSRLFPWESFDIRVNSWMNSLMEDDFSREYYEVTHVDIFKNIVSHSIQSIEFAGIKGDKEPFGVKIVFASDYLLLTPNARGSTLETSHFNKNNNLVVFRKLGVIEFRDIQH